MNPITEILSKRYPPNAYVLMEEVSDKAGFARSRSADYIVMSLWPSRGLYLEGIELKSHRGDWLRELKTPNKAENIFQYCDMFWLLTEDDSVAKIEEIPGPWGWISIRNGKIYVLKEAPRLTPKPITKSFLAALLKRAADKTGWVHQSKIQDRLNEAKEQGERNRNYEKENIQQNLDDLRSTIKEFEEKSGIKLESYYGHFANKQIGEAVKYLLANTPEVIHKRLLTLEANAQKILNDIREGVKLLNGRT